ncbi:hypothetical protein [Oceanivirga salmonicida]|uniref:hypothetical protein n=1 Tax=Oceanivirga salmonicida TaxID=1769291 RepID=UPI00082FE66D|nr:hypothetical protein [Oceanivirga salmonicida]
MKNLLILTVLLITSCKIVQHEVKKANSNENVKMNIKIRKMNRKFDHNIEKIELKEDKIITPYSDYLYVSYDLM